MCVESMTAGGSVYVSVETTLTSAMANRIQAFAFRRKLPLQAEQCWPVSMNLQETIKEACRGRRTCRQKNMNPPPGEFPSETCGGQNRPRL